MLVSYREYFLWDYKAEALTLNQYHFISPDISEWGFVNSHIFVIRWYLKQIATKLMPVRDVD